MRPVFAILAASLLASAAGAQQAPPGCNSAAHRQFDFWVGDWTVTDSARTVTYGSNLVTREEAGCLVHEHWAGSKGGTGQSFNFHEPRTGKWEQVWVAAGGGNLHLRASRRSARRSSTGPSGRRIPTAASGSSGGNPPTAERHGRSTSTAGMRGGSVRTMSIRLFALLAALPLSAQSTSLEPGIAHFNARRWQEAHAFFAGAARAQPQNPDAAYWLGKTLMAENKAGDAEDWFDKAAALDPRSSEYQLWLARAIGLQAQRANVLRQPFLARRTKAAVDKAIMLDANNIDAREMRWQFFTMAPGVMGGGADKARAEAAEILRRNRYRGQFIALQMAGRARDTVAAERIIKAMVAEYADSVQPVSTYASRLVDGGRVSEAFAVVEAYQKRRPADPVALYHVGRIAAVSGQQMERGELALRKYLAVAPPPANNVPTLSNAHFRLGSIQERRGDKASARAEYELAVRLDARNEQAKRALSALK